jgi:hypothetical protein
MQLPRDPRSFDGRARSEQRRNIDGLQVHPDTLSARKSAYNQLCLADFWIVRNTVRVPWKVETHAKAPHGHSNHHRRIHNSLLVFW